MHDYVIGGGIAVAVAIGGLMAWSFRHPKSSSRLDSKLAGSLRDEKQKSDIILSAIEDGVMLLGKDRSIQLFNQGASTLTGWPEADARGLDFASVIKLTNSKGETYTDDQNPFLTVYKQ